MTTHIHLVTDEEALADAARGDHDLAIQLLCSVVINLSKDVARLTKKVADLEGRERI